MLHNTFNIFLLINWHHFTPPATEGRALVKVLFSVSETPGVTFNMEKWHVSQQQWQVFPFSPPPSSPHGIFRTLHCCCCCECYSDVEDLGVALLIIHHLWSQIGLLCSVGIFVTPPSLVLLTERRDTKYPRIAQLHMLRTYHKSDKRFYADLLSQF